jgi:hypothetical protein
LKVRANSIDIYAFALIENKGKVNKNVLMKKIFSAAGNTNCRGRLSTVDLLIRATFCKKGKYNI